MINLEVIKINISIYIKKIILNISFIMIISNI